jgi:putative (di)nucleoside polyphosphate hydrolase
MDSPKKIPPRQTKTDQNLAPAPPQSDDLDLMGLLDAPEVRLLMEVDGVDREELIAMLNRTKLALGSHDPPGATRDEARYRPGVGILLVNERRQIFIAQRCDVDHPAWQMPQGGIEDGETPQQAALRELKEEIGTDHAAFVIEAPHWIYYDVPAKLAQRAWGGRWIGQRQVWFLMAFKGTDSEINLATEHPEFSAWCWADPKTLIGLAAPFKRQLYEAVFGQFDAFFRS